MKKWKTKVVTMVIMVVLICNFTVCVSAWNISPIDQKACNDTNCREDAEYAVNVLKNAVDSDLDNSYVEELNGLYSVNTDSQETVISKNGTIEIEVKSKSLKFGVDVFPEHHSVEITNVHDVLVARSDEEDYMVTSEIFDGGLRNSFVIDEQCDEENFPIQMELPEGAHIEFSKDEYADNEMDGSLLIYDESNMIIGAVGIPWAKDADGTKLDTYYKVEDNAISQYVHHIGCDVQYPIVADPVLTFDSCFKSGKWITRDGVVSLSLEPNATLRAAMIQGSSSMRKYSWSTVVSKFGNSKKWKNTSSMKDQYHCHWYFAFYKSKFNLEPSRKSTSWANMLAHKCNP